MCTPGKENILTAYIKQPGRNLMTEKEKGKWPKGDEGTKGWVPTSEENAHVEDQGAKPLKSPGIWQTCRHQKEALYHQSTLYKLIVK